MMPDTESTNEPHKSGHRLTDMVVSVSAIFISLCSLALALRHGETMERLVEANSRPFIQFDTSNGKVGPNGEVTRELSVSISNPGSGSARIETFEMALDGHVLSGWGEALKQLKQEAVAKHLISSDTVSVMVSYANVAPSYLKAAGEQVVMRWRPDDAASPLWDYIDSARQSGRFTFKACYCSIFDECWVVRSGTFRPAPVKNCT
jgi:hypothetical protein